MSSPVIVHRSGIQVLFAPFWQTFFWAFAAVLLGQAGLALTNAWRPYWTPQRASIRLLLDVAGSVLFCFLAQAKIVQSIVIPLYTPDRCIALRDAINLWAQRCFPIFVIASVILATIDTFRFVRVQRSANGSYRPVVADRAGSHS